MLKVTVELWPGGRESQRRELAVLQIANITPAASTSGLDDYAIFASEGVNPVAQRGFWESHGMIAGLDRRQSVFALLEKSAAWANAEAEKR